MFHSRWEEAIREKQLIIKSAFLLNGKTGRSCGTTNGKVLPNGNFMEKQKGVTSDVFLFSRVYRNDRNITEPLPHHTHVPCSKITSGKNRSI